MDDKLIVDNNNNAKFVLLLPLRNVNKSDAPRLKILIQNPLLIKPIIIG
jgi:hypothetical protein